MDPDVNAKPAIRNKTWAELNVGDAASLERTCSMQDLVLFAHVYGNVNPLMLPPVENGAENSRPVAPSMRVSWLISAVLGNVLPGAGTLYRGQDLRFPRRVHSLDPGRGGAVEDGRAWADPRRSGRRPVGDGQRDGC